MLSGKDSLGRRLSEKGEKDTSAKAAGGRSFLACSRNRLGARKAEQQGEEGGEGSRLPVWGPGKDCTMYSEVGRSGSDVISSVFFFLIILATCVGW